MESNSENSPLPLIQTFPAELLAKIFILCIATRPPSIHVFAKPPISLCRVCRSWREVALGLPRLWTTISVDMEVLPQGAEENKSLSDLVHQWVARASPFPLTFNFNRKETMAFNAFLVPFAHRLRHLDISGWVHQKSLSDLQFPVLETIIVRKGVDIYRYDDDKPTLLFPSAPYLRRVCLPLCLEHGISGPLREAKLLLSWNQLTHLYIGNILELSEWQGMLRKCLNLQQGTFMLSDGTCGTPEIPQAPEKRVILHHLGELTITFLLWIRPAILLPFEFPALKTLRVDTTGRRDEAPWAEAVHRIFFQELLPLQILCLGGTWAYKPTNLNLLLEAYHYLRTDTRYQSVLDGLEHNRKSYYPLAPNLDILIVELTPRPWQIGSVTVTMLSNVLKKSPHQEERRLEGIIEYLDEDAEAKETIIQMTAELQPWVDDEFHLELNVCRPSGSQFSRATLATIGWKSEGFGE